MKIEDYFKTKRKVKFSFLVKRNGSFFAILEQKHRRGYPYRLVIEIGKQR